MSLPSDFADIWKMHPKLRHDVVFLEAPSGAYLRGADSAFLLKGRSAFRWLTTLSPYLTGEHSLEQMCGALDDGQRQTVATLVRALTTRGFIKDAGVRTEAPEPVARRFASQIEFVDHFADDATRRFLRFHGARVVLGGAGTALLAAATGLLRNGCVNLDVHPDGDPEAFRNALRAEAEELRADGVDAEVRVSDGPLDTAGADAVVYCTDRAGLPRVLELTRHCHAGGPLLIPVVWDGSRAVLGPAGGIGGTPCWLCAHLRLTANSDPAAAADSWRHLAIGAITADPGRISDVVARMVGNAAAFEVFRALTGALPPDTASSVVVLDLSTLESTRERVLRHPRCPVCRQAGEEAGEEPVPLTEEEVYQRAEVLVSPNAGVFTRFVDDPLEQAPLKTARLRVPPVDGTGGARDITAFDVGTVMGARLRAYKVAVRDYVGRIADPGGAVVASAAELAASGRPPVPWTGLSTASGAVPYDPDRRLTWLPARVLGGQEPVWVPAAVVLPFSGANRDFYAERTVAGSAVAGSVDELVADCLAGALAYEALRDVLQGRSALVPVPEADLIADDHTALVVKAAHRFGHRLRVFALAGAAPSHAVLAMSQTDDTVRPLWTVGAALTARQARLAAVRDLVGLMQVGHFEGVDADLGDPLLADFDPRAALPTAADPASPGMAASADTTTSAVLAALRDRGRTALLVETTTPDIRATRALVAGVVLLWRRDPALS